MKQSVLYSHFMAKKLGMETENKDHSHLLPEG